MTDRPAQIAFFIPQTGPWISANDSLHWAEKARYVRTWRMTGAVHARKERLPKLERAQIDAWIHKTTNRKYDAANLQGTLKALVDGMVTDYGLLPDDDNAHLAGPFVHAGEKRAQPGITIIITPETATRAPESPAGVQRSGSTRDGQ